MGDTRVCNKCKVEKSVDEFYHRRNYHSGHTQVHATCKTCCTAETKLRHRRIKYRVVQLMGGECSQCGYSRNMANLHLHHRDPEEKEYDWGQLLRMARRWDEVLVELEKCDLLCSYCHTELHHPDEDMELLALECACPVCGGETYGKIYCSAECKHEGLRKYPRPSKDELASLLEQGWSIRKLRERYHASHGTIINWIAKYGLREYGSVKVANTIE